jgi:uncharacterized damage-inducible protein DinB
LTFHDTVRTLTGMTVQEILTLFEYDEWATDRTLESVSALPEKTYLEDLKSSHGGIHGTLVHLYSASRTWLERWKGNTVSRHVTVDEVPALGLLRSRWKEYRADLGSYLRTVTDDALAAPFGYSDLRGNRHSEPLAQQMLHVTNHATYHRGQVVTLLRQVRGTPLATDLVVFFRMKKGETA